MAVGQLNPQVELAAADDTLARTDHLPAVRVARVADPDPVGLEVMNSILRPTVG